MSTAPFRIAIVGSGPSGFYAAEALLRSGREVHVDLFERLAVPFGLVRFGVAPDHPKLKQVTAVFERIAAMPGFRFIGGVEVGADLTVDALRQAYHAVVLATGAADGRELGIPGETLRGHHSASDFVGWYNGHPDCRDCHFDLSGERAIVIGHGNVALDVARILMKTPDELRNTDIAAHALEVLAESRIREVHIVGRRGPAETRFSAKELLEFQTLSLCEPLVVADDLAEGSFLPPAGADAERQAAIALLEAFSQQARAKSRQCVFRFHLEPLALEGGSQVERALFQRTSAGETRARPEQIDCGLVISSVGRRTKPLAGVPYDSVRGVHANAGGRIVDRGVLIPRLYTCGWSKRGPSGTIGTNRACAVETVEKLLGDLDATAGLPLDDADTLIAVARGRAGFDFDFAAWKTIDAAEIERGRRVGKPREKFVSMSEMVRVLE